MIKNIDDIRTAGADMIKEVVNKYINLKKTGTNWTACCPFHQEKTPSFSVSPSKGIYKCFGCGESGDAIQFVMDYEGLTFVEAAEAVAAITNTSVEYAAGEHKQEVIQRAKERKDLQETQRIALEKVLKAWKGMKFPDDIINEYEAYWFSHTTTKEVDLLFTIDGRAYPFSTIQKFEIVYAGQLVSLKDMAEGLQLSPSTLHQLGLIKDGQHGSFDHFRDRVIFPIRDHNGKLRGFAGRKARKCTNKKIPKYLNSPESASFNKSEILYGLHLAKRQLRNDEPALLTEGYTDAISLHMAGLNTTVATCGTALTKEQAELLKRFTDKVVLLYDGDSAGQEAAKRAVPILIQAGIIPKVCLLTDGEDPDSYIRRVGASKFKAYLSENTKDGLVWRVMLEWHPDDEFKKTECYRLAAELLTPIKDTLLQDEYKRTLCRKENMGAVAKRLDAALKDMETKQLSVRGKKLNSSQTHSAIHYGIYVDRNKYYEKGGKGDSEITNFHIKPIMLIRGREQSFRLVQVTNEFGHSFTADVDSKVMTQFGLFKIYIEQQGNYLFNEYAKESHWIRIRRMLYEHTPTVYPIYTMGLHKEGFFTWANGITDENGKFHPVDENGVVRVNDVGYFIRAGAQINTDVLSDDDEDVLSDQKNLVYVTGQGCPSIKEWSELFIKTHGKNGMIAIAWFIANFYRDIVHPKYNSFPHLNAYGPPRSGKSFLGWSLQYMYGAIPKGMMSILTDTIPSLPRAVAWCRNYCAWYDEYKNDIATERVEVLKAIYDGKGRGKARGGYGHSTVKSPVNSGAYISGQEPLTKDNALMTRSICVKIVNDERSNEQISAATRLRDIEQSGILTQITASLMKYRSTVQLEWFTEFDGIRSQLREYFKNESIKIDDRLIMNAAMVLSVFVKVAKFEEFSFDYNDLMEYMVQIMKDQITDMVEEDEAGVFWQIVDFLLMDGRIRHQKDIKVEHSNREKFYIKGGSYDEQTWTEPKKLIYLNLARIHGLYMEQHYKQRKTDGQEKSSLRTYLASSDGYLGIVQKKFAGQNRKVLVFDVDQLDLDFPLTAEAIRPVGVE